MGTTVIIKNTILKVAFSEWRDTAGVSYFQYRVPAARSNSCRTSEFPKSLQTKILGLQQSRIRTSLYVISPGVSRRLSRCYYRRKSKCGIIVSDTKGYTEWDTWSRIYTEWDTWGRFRPTFFWCLETRKLGNSEIPQFHVPQFPHFGVRKL